ncbi:hypothetical protein Mal52_25990 [Symmachiella dynata]|uniref:Uncharacterized protein n=1 Tax=Symmachiella dynata TaxID=2527995 RepID=A0A517ZNT9_9PLAN|nr:hypothetical protein Mal52_25990 [Symmachiella dynata]
MIEHSALVPPEVSAEKNRHLIVFSKAAAFHKFLTKSSLRHLSLVTIVYRWSGEAGY